MQLYTYMQDIRTGYQLIESFQCAGIKDKRIK